MITQCAVKDAKGNNCPEQPTKETETNRGKALVCASCLRNIEQGAYKGISISKGDK